MGQPEVHALESVFKISGVPEITFVEPVNFDRLKVALRTPGRGIVLEGPSGVGKTVAVLKALDRLGMADVKRLSGRRQTDLNDIDAVLNGTIRGTILIDDVHRLPAEKRSELSNLLKILADEEDDSRKLILVGINYVGQSLVRVSPDLANRIDVLTFERNPAERLLELVELGELALNVVIESKETIIRSANGSFYLTQLLCHETCIQCKISATASINTPLSIPYEQVESAVMERLERNFGERTRNFASGPRFRKEGRAPYLRLLKWLSESETWSIQIGELLNRNQEHRGSVGQIIDKGYLQSFIEGKREQPGFDSILHFNPQTKFLSGEDPQFMFYIRNLDWPIFVRRLGYGQIDFSSRYDIAMSFAGEQRRIVEQLVSELEDRELAVFYDNKEQHLILGEALDKYLGPIYETEAELIIVFLSREYPHKVWTRFESDKFAGRIPKGEIIAVKFSDVTLGNFDKLDGIGHLDFIVDKPTEAQVAHFARVLAEKVASRRTNAVASPQMEL